MRHPRTYPLIRHIRYFLLTWKSLITGHAYWDRRRWAWLDAVWRGDA